tara:strand:- start:1362 stop:2414 length:1053 start_codon:yes stop_codon:yes gene_type:complete
LVEGDYQSSNRRPKGMTTKRQTKFLPMNHPDMCWARVWCRETGIAGGQGGYEKACHLQQTGDHICGFHKKKGLQMGLITEERPNYWGEDGNVCPNDKKEGADIKWKCAPPDYSLTHGDHKYKVRDETVGKDLLRDKMNKKMEAMEKKVKSMEKQLAKETEKRHAAEELAKQMVIAHYELGNHFSNKRDGEGGYVPAQPTDPEVSKEFAELKTNINILHRQKNEVDCRKIRRETKFKNDAFNEIFWDSYKNVSALVKGTKVEGEVKDQVEVSEVVSNIREMLFNIADKVVEEKCQKTDNLMKRIAAQTKDLDDAIKRWEKNSRFDPDLTDLLVQYHGQRKEKSKEWKKLKC